MLHRFECLDDGAEVRPLLRLFLPALLHELYKLRWAVRRDLRHVRSQVICEYLHHDLVGLEDVEGWFTADDLPKNDAIGVDIRLCRLSSRALHRFRSHPVERTCLPRHMVLVRIECVSSREAKVHDLHLHMVSR